MKKNDEFRLTITDISDDGSGIGRHEGFVYFVKGALPGDEILVGATAIRKNHGYARIIEILNPSPDRVEPKCSASGKCGGCSIMHLSYNRQLSLKEKKVADALIRIGGFEEAFIKSISFPIVGMDEPFHFRNKAQYPVSVDKDGRLQIGFYAQHSHRIVETPTCYIGQAIDKGILDALRIFITECGLSSVIRHILIRHGEGIMVCIVAKAFPKDAIPSLKKALSPFKGDIVSVCVNYNNSNDNVILGRRTETLFGQDYLTDKLLGHSFKISARSFYQVNKTQTEKLYKKALEYAALNGSETVYDLYCGIGTITLFLASSAKRVIGIEEVPDAIRDAKENASINKVNNVEFFCGKTEDLLPDIKERPNVIVLDPPRKGCEKSVLDVILSSSPDRIVYVSCNPSTLARDIKILCSDGRYSLSAITPVDQFCHTMHVEVVVKMSRTK